MSGVDCPLMFTIIYEPLSETKSVRVYELLDDNDNPWVGNWDDAYRKAIELSDPGYIHYIQIVTPHRTSLILDVDLVVMAICFRDAP